MRPDGTVKITDFGIAWSAANATVTRTGPGMLPVVLSVFGMGMTAGTLVSAWADWYWHLAAAPGKQMELASKAQRKASRFALYMAESLQGSCAPCIQPLPQDRRGAGRRRSALFPPDRG